MLSLPFIARVSPRHHLPVYMRVLFVGAGLLLARPMPAQSTIALDPRTRINQYILEKWQTEQGLPQGNVSAIAQTRDGYLWLASQLGLTRFDGVTFTTFSARNTAGLKDMNITALYVDREGTMWIGTGLGGVSTLRNGRFTAIDEDLPAPTVNCIYQDRAGTMWVGTRAGLARLERGRFRPVPGVSTYVYALGEDGSGALLVGTERGLIAYANDRVSDFADGAPHIDGPVGALMRDRQGALWIGLTGEVRRIAATVTTRFTSAASVPASLVRSFTQDRSGVIWMGMEDGGVARLRGDRFETFTMADGLLGNSAVAMVEDREGSLWVGTHDGGLNRFRNSSFITYGQREGLPADILWSVYGDRDGSMLVGANHSGLTRFANGKFSTIAEKEGFPSMEARTMLRTSSGQLWVGTDKAMLRQRPDGVWENLSGPGRVPAGRPRAIVEDRSGALWIGGTFGLVRYAHGQFHDLSAEAGIQRAVVWTIVEERDGTLWIATAGEGLIRYANGAFQRFTTKDGLSHNVIESLHAGAEGLWIGSLLGGLDVMRNGKISRLPVSSVAMADLLSISEDRYGKLWLSSSQGLFSVSKSQLLAAADGRQSSVRFHKYDMLDGLRGTEFDGAGLNSVWKGPDGRLWYPSTKGLVVVDPDHQPTNPLAPLVHVERLVVDGREVSPTDGVEIPRGGGTLEIAYAATSLLIPSRVTFRYKLEGYESDWVDAGNRRVAYYTGLPAGRYMFRVMAANNDGVWNETGASLAVHKLPQFHETVWFYLACAVGLIGIAVGVSRLWMRGVQQRARDLARLVNERTAELKSSEERYRSLFDANPQPVWVYDVETLRFLAVNPAAMQHYGYTADEFRAMTVENVMCPDSMLSNTASYRIESWRDRPIRRDAKKDGTIIEVEVDEHPIVFAGRSASMSVISDVTARRDLEERLRQAQKMEAVGQLAGGIAHDLNNVLTAVMAHVDLAVTTLPPESMCVTDLTQAQSAAHRGATMIRKLLGFSRRERLVLKPLDLGSLTRELAATITRMLPSNIEVAVTHPEGLPPVAADAGAVQQIVLNLATNARDAMSDGGTLKIDIASTVLDETHTAALGLRMPGNYVVLSVTDTGDGMEPETLARVFEPYFSTKGEGHGSGLGMAMVYGLIKQHMGYVRVESQPGFGTVVSLYFPACADAAPTAVLAAANSVEHANETILVVEDEDAVRAAATRVLTRQGYRVLSAANGREGLEVWRANADDIDLVLSDAIMPGMSGQALFAAIREERPGVRMLLMSGYSGEEVKQSIPASEDVPFLPKPWTVSELSARVREVLTPALAG